MSDTDVTDAGTLTADEQKFFDTGGASGLPDGGQADTGTKDTTETTQQTDAEKDGGKDGGEKVEKMVSLSALHEERSRRKASDSKLREMETQLAEMRGRFAIIDRINAPQKAAVPDPETDFVGAIRHQGETLAEVRKRLDQQDEASKQAASQQELMQDYAAAANQFEQATPDFKEAYKHLLTSRVAELSALGYGEQAIRKTLRDEEMLIAQTAFQNGRNPGEVIYDLAKHRGYVKKAEPSKDGGKAGADKFDTIERGQQTNKSLSNTGGSSGEADMTADMLLKMPMDEFEAWCAKNPAKAKRIMGG